MCRWVAYSGAPVFISELVTSPANSLIVQSHAARECKTRINGDGFGLAWYGELPEPGLYRDVLPAWSDCNLKSIAAQIRSRLFMAHIRASTGSTTSRQNCHPFTCGRWSFMHNGQIRDFERLRRMLESRLSDRLFALRTGSTDSELFFLLMMEHIEKLGVGGAVRAALDIVLQAAALAGIKPLVRLTAALSDGETLYAIRFSTDEICPSLYRCSRGDEGICLVSEPLDSDRDRWEEIPAGTMLAIRRGASSLTTVVTGLAA